MIIRMHGSSKLVTNQPRLCVWWYVSNIFSVGCIQWCFLVSIIFSLYVCAKVWLEGIASSHVLRANGSNSLRFRVTLENSFVTTFHTWPLDLWKGLCENLSKQLSWRYNPRNLFSCSSRTVDESRKTVYGVNMQHGINIWRAKYALRVPA